MTLIEYRKILEELINRSRIKARTSVHQLAFGSSETAKQLNNYNYIHDNVSCEKAEKVLNQNDTAGLLFKF